MGLCLQGGTSSRGQERAQHGGASRDNGLASVPSSEQWGHGKPPGQTYTHYYMPGAEPSS